MAFRKKIGFSSILVLEAGTILVCLFVIGFIFQKNLTFQKAQANPGHLISPLFCKSFEECIEMIINFIFWIAITITPIIIITAGIYFIFSGGDPNRIQTAKKIILYAVIGLAIVLFSKGLISLIKNIIGG